AMGADPVIYDPVPAPQVASPFSWAGPYIGLHTGVVFDLAAVATEGTRRCSRRLRANEPVPPECHDVGADRFSIDGFVGGVHAGYNWQNDSFVYGIEGDLDYTNLKGGSDFDYAGGP